MPLRKTIANLFIALRANSSGLKTDLNSAARAIKKQELAVRSLRRSAQRFNRTSSKMRRSLIRFGAVILPLLGVSGIAGLSRLFVRAADTMQLVSSRLRVVVRDVGQFRDAQKQIFQVAQETRLPLENLTDLYARVGRSTRALGYTSREIIPFIRSVSKAIIVSGSTAAEASAGLIQFSQGLAQNRLAGDEFRSVAEQLPRLALAIADGLGKSLGELRELAHSQRLTTDLIFKGLSRSAKTLDEEFKLIPRTVGQAFVQVKNQLFSAANNLNNVTDSTKALVSAVDVLRRVLADPGLARNFQNVILKVTESITFLVERTHLVSSSFKVLGELVAGYLVYRLAAFSRTVYLAAGALKGLGVAAGVAKLGLGALVSPGKGIFLAIAALGYLYLRLKKSTTELEEFRTAMIQAVPTPQIIRGIERIDERISGLVKKLFEYQDRFDQLDPSLDSSSLKRSIDEIEESIRGLRETRVELQISPVIQEIERVDARISELVKKLSEYRSNLALLATGTSFLPPSILKEYDRAGTDLEELLSGLRRHRADLQISILPTGSLEAQAAEVKFQIEESQRNLSELEANAKKLREAVASDQESFGEVDASRLTRDIIDPGRLVASARTELNSLFRELAKIDKQIKASVEDAVPDEPDIADIRRGARPPIPQDFVLGLQRQVDLQNTATIQQRVLNGLLHEAQQLSGPGPGQDEGLRRDLERQEIALRSRFEIENQIQADRLKNFDELSKAFSDLAHAQSTHNEAAIINAEAVLKVREEERDQLHELATAEARIRGEQQKNASNLKTAAQDLANAQLSNDETTIANAEEVLKLYEEEGHRLHELLSAHHQLLGISKLATERQKDYQIELARTFEATKKTVEATREQVRLYLEAGILAPGFEDLAIALGDQERFLERINTQLEKRQKLIKETTKAFTDGLVQAVFHSNSLLQSLKNIGIVLAKSLLSRFIAGVVASFIPAPLSSVAPSTIPRLPISGLGGFRQHGGPVIAGRQYLVGEGGPELFAPNVSGRIHPNSSLGGRQMSVEMNFNIRSSDGPAVRRAVLDVLPEVIGPLRDVIRAETQQDLSRPSPLSDSASG